MVSIDQMLTQSTRAARKTLANHWVFLCDRFGTPSEHSALGGLHYLLTEYSEPSPADAARLYKVDPGPYAVERRDERLGESRAGNLPVTLTIPVGREPDRVFLLSPGLGAHGSANRYLEHHLASHGYLVVRPRHRGSDIWATVFKTPLGAFTRRELKRRLEELEAVLDALEAGAWGTRFEASRIALGGHSFGALTSCVLAGLPVKDIAGVNQARKFGALIALSPYGDSFPTRRLGIEVQGFERLTTPVLFMSGSKDELFTLGKGSRAHLEPFRLARRAVNRRHVVVGDTRHGNFSEVFGWMKRETKMMVNSTVTAFLDCHLGGSKEAATYLAEQLPLAAFEHGSWAL